MKQMFATMTLLGGLVACSDGSDTGEKARQTVDGGASDSGHIIFSGDGGMDAGSGDAGEDASLVVKVTNPGAACAMAPESCTGASATCESTDLSGDRFPGGYCSASCLFSEECGAAGDCPIGEIIRTLGAAAVKGLTAGMCYEKCRLGDVSSCRPKYECTTLAAALNVKAPNSNIPALKRPVCVPAKISRDGGVGDAGNQRAADAGGIGIDSGA